jgi:pyruvate,water dikinase
MNATDHVVWFHHEHCADVAIAGGKGASLSRMTGLGLPVPPGFVVPAGSLRAALHAAGTLEQVRAPLTAVTSDAELGAVADAAHAAVLGTPASGELAAAVAEAYRRMSRTGEDAEVAVRSSAVSEDSETASFAGQQETYLHVHGADEVLARIRECWASFFTERALFYRRQKGSLEDFDIAVVVQRMVTPDVAGVLFTIDPTRGRRDRMVVEAVLGLGEGVVSGQLTPDHYQLARDGTVKRSKVAEQPYAVVRGEHGGVREEPLPPGRGSAPKLDADQLRRLAEVGRELEERLGRPQDIEWAIEGGELYVLQARPVTT